MVSNGVITTVAGNGTPGFSGDNGPATTAQLFYPDGVAVDAAGNVYISDSFNNRIRMVSNGVIATVAGNGTPGFTGDNGPATSAQLQYPGGALL
jgi:DNA-binding beta-propeller fold protein YncE